VAAPDSATSARPTFTHALEDGRWIATRALTSGEPSPWRSALKVPLGQGDGVFVGGAVTGVGARLVGRVLAVGLATSDVALLNDPGFSLAAIARVAGIEEPKVLGRLTTLGRGPRGGVRLRWIVRLAFDLGASREARLFSGSGEPGLPGGLLLGTTTLPRAVAVGEEHELVLDPHFDPEKVERLFVRSRDERETP
jgi:hypothetical protein